jgi:hypothetical protein
LSAPNGVRFLLIFFLSMAATSVFGQETVRTLAMVRYDQPSVVRTPVAVHADSVAYSFDNISAPHLPYRLAVLKVGHQNDAGFFTGFRLEPPNGSDQGDLFRLIHKNLSAVGRTGNWLNVEVGYGPINDGEFDIKKSTVELQRPGYAFLKASLSF